MPESRETRDKTQRNLEDIHNSLVAVSRKVAQLELDLPDESDLRGQLDTVLNQLGPLTDAAQQMMDSHQLETNRMANEDELA